MPMHPFFVAGCLAVLSSVANAQSVVTYHNDPGRSGLYVAPNLTRQAAANIHPDTGFQGGPLYGAIYAQPLYWQPAGSAGQLIVATEANLVYALDASSGGTLRITQLGKAVPVTSLPCGDIQLNGVTGTPVIDPTTGTLYLGALTIEGQRTIREQAYAVSLSDGTILPHWPLDIQESARAIGAPFNALYQGDRSAVQFFQGRIYLSYGGRAGDCGAYHGSVIEVTPGSTPGVTAAWWTRAKGGGIWAQGGVSSDGTALYATTGNTFSNQNWVDGEAILRLTPGLVRPATRKDFFTPTNWKQLDNLDQDLGGTQAVPFNVPSAFGPLPRLLALGKDGNAYLVDRSNLGGIGGALAIVKVSNGSIITEPALYTTESATLAAFTNTADPTCGGNAVTMLKVTVNSITPLWCAPLRGRGAPIITTTDGVANPIVWVTGAEGDNQLHGFDAMTGAVVFSGAGTTMSGLHRYGTILSANNRLYVAADGRVYAFRY